MKAITAVGATPQRMEILYSILREAGETGEDREHLAAMVGPNSLAKNGDDPGEDNAFGDCLSLGQEMGLLIAAGDNVRLTDAGGAKSFLEVARRQMIDEVQTAEPVEGWVAGAVAWMLCQDPRDPLPWSGSNAVNRLQSQFGTLPYGMTNDSRFQQAVYWARALGFVTRLNLKKEVVVSDPTAALEQRLDILIPKGQEMTLAAFLANLARICPVFDGGSVWREVNGRIGAQSQDRAVSLSLALALHRLKQRGALEFSYLDDAKSVFVQGLLGDGLVSHVSRPGAYA